MSMRALPLWLVLAVSCADEADPTGGDADSDTDTGTDTGSDTGTGSETDTGSDTGTGTPGDCERSDGCPADEPSKGFDCNVPGSAQCSYEYDGCQTGYECDVTCNWNRTVEEPPDCAL